MRKDILESAKSLNLGLLDFSYMKEIRNSKKKKIEEVSKLIKLMREEIKNINLPNVPSVVIKNKVVSKETIEKEETSSYDEHDKLASELRDIEEKLASI